MNLIDVVEKDYAKNGLDKWPEFSSGDTVSVHARIKEGEKSRIQIFQGLVIGITRTRSMNGNFRVRKMSSGVGVERVFPFHSPNVEKVELVSKGKSRRSKLYFLRDRTGKSAKVDMDYDKKD
jgi:large subunit ribosomal protein L19